MHHGISIDGWTDSHGAWWPHSRLSAILNCCYGHGASESNKLDKHYSQTDRWNILTQLRIEVSSVSCLLYVSVNVLRVGKQCDCKCFFGTLWQLCRRRVQYVCCLYVYTHTHAQCYCQGIVVRNTPSNNVNFCSNEFGRSVAVHTRQNIQHYALGGPLHEGWQRQACWSRMLGQAPYLSCEWLVWP